MKVDKLWQRLNYLVPDPDCNTTGDEYDSIEWSDARIMPTIIQVQAVLDLDMTTGAIDRSVDREVLSRINRLIVGELVGILDRLRALEGLPPAIRLDYLNQLKSKYKTL